MGQKLYPLPSAAGDQPTRQPPCAFSWAFTDTAACRKSLSSRNLNEALRSCSGAGRLSFLHQLKKSSMGSPTINQNWLYAYFQPLCLSLFVKPLENWQMNDIATGWHSFKTFGRPAFDLLRAWRAQRLSPHPLVIGGWWSIYHWLPW